MNPISPHQLAFDLLLLPFDFRLSPRLITGPGADRGAAPFDANVEAVPPRCGNATRGIAEEISLPEFVENAKERL